MLRRSLPSLVVTLAAMSSFAVLSAGCGDKPDNSDDNSDDNKAAEGEGEAADTRTVVTAEGAAGAAEGVAGAAGQAAGGSFAAELAAPTPADAVKARLGGSDPVVPLLGGPSGRLIDGWTGLRAGMKPKELLRSRPLARNSDLTGLVYTETLASPWIAASYRFERLTSNIAHVQWLAGPLASGNSVFRGMSKQGLHRWRRRPRFTEDADHRRAHFDTADGPILLTMANSDGAIKMEWHPTQPDAPDPLQAALDSVSGRRRRAPGSGGDVGGGNRNAGRASAPTDALPARPDGTPPVSRP